jgi:hypothetical protein
MRGNKFFEIGGTFIAIVIKTNLKCEGGLQDVDCVEMKGREYILK